jgi:hypothetical protein
MFVPSFCNEAMMAIRANAAGRHGDRNDKNLFPETPRPKPKMSNNPYHCIDYKNDLSTIGPGRTHIDFPARSFQAVGRNGAKAGECAVRPAVSI